MFHGIAVGCTTNCVYLRAVCREGAIQAAEVKIWLIEVCWTQVGLLW